MNRIKELLKKMPAKEATQPVNIIYADNTVFKDNTNDYAPGHFDVLVKEIRKTIHPRVKKSRYLITRDEDQASSTLSTDQVAASDRATNGDEEEEKEESNATSTTSMTENEDKEDHDKDKAFDEVSLVLEESQNRRSQVVAETAYFLNNRKTFVHFIKKFFGDYKTELARRTTAATCEDMAGASDNQRLTLLVHQRLIADYLNHYTPYRGLLLFHGLGSGKTCSSIAIAEGFKNPNKQVVVMTPASLRANFLKEIKKCGDLVYRIHQNWVWKPYEKLKPDAEQLEHDMYLSPGYIQAHKGAWVVSRDPPMTRPPTTANVTRKSKKQSLHAQLTTMLEKKYTHYNYNGGITQKTLEALTHHGKVNPFDNKVVIIDEAHKFVTTIVNQLRGSKQRASGVFPKLYELLLSAKNARMLLLTGTPLVNYPNEAAVVFNLLRGYIRTFEVSVRPNIDIHVTNESLWQRFQESDVAKEVDYFHYSPTTQTVTFTRNPFPFLNVSSTGGPSSSSSTAATRYTGVRRRSTSSSSNPATKDEGVEKDDEEVFLRRVSNALKDANMDIQGVVRKHNYKNLPDNLDAFVSRFYSPEGVLLHKAQLSNRLLGLVSYFSGTPELLPRYNQQENYHLVTVPMSNYQAEQYALERSKELKQEKENAIQSSKAAANQGAMYDEPASSYKIFSRLYCNFAFPQELVRPKPASFQDASSSSSSFLKKRATGGTNSKEKDPLVVEENDTKEQASGPETGTEEEELADPGKEETEAGQEQNEEPELEPEEQKKPTDTDKNDVVEEKTPREKKETKEEKEIPIPVSSKKTRKRKTRILLLEDDEEQEPHADQESESKSESETKTKKASVPAPEDKETEEATEEEEVVEEDDVEPDADDSLSVDATYNQQIKQALAALNEHGERYFSKEGLLKHSPKFWKMIENIQSAQHEGLHLVYSQFRTMEGLGIFSLALNYHGFAELKIEKDPDTKTWKLHVAPEDIDKPKYVLYTGNQSKELKDILLHIYNGAFDALSAVSPEVAEALSKMADTNRLGEIVKVFMITASGAEGLDLKNTRYVHLMEPFWNLVRVEQVIGRAVRICSHQALPAEKRTVEAFLYLSVFSKAQLDAYHHPEAKTTRGSISATLRQVMTKDRSESQKGTPTPITTDQNLYEISKRKEKTIAQLLQVIKEASIDCTVYPRNKTEGLRCFTQPAEDSTSLDFSYLPNYEQDIHTDD